MKIAIINDTHFGARNDSSLFLEHFLSFFENQFFPYLEENNIDTIIHLGDLMDRRKYVNFNTLNLVRTKFIEKIKEKNIKFHMILGNHDTFYKNTNEVNSTKELFSHYDFFKLYESPEKVKFDGLEIMMIPWICKENKDDVVSFIQSNNSPILCGHLELRGYQVMPGVSFTEGMSDNIFSKFEMVLSGHFHSKSTKKNVYYLGTQYQITFGDTGQTKGFHVLNTETRDLHYIENKEKMFYILNSDISDLDLNELRNKYVKYLISKDDEQKITDSNISKIESASPCDLTIVEDFTIGDEKISVDLSKDTITIINEEINNLEIDVNIDRLKKITHEIYLEAISQ